MLNRGLLQLFNECRPALLRYLRLRGAMADEAQDILQDVHVKLWSQSLGEVEQPRAYLYKMTNNHYLRHRRTAGRRSRREQEWAVLQGGERPEIDDQPSAEARVMASEQLAILQRVLDGLPERTRTIFRRFRVDGDPCRLIAADYDISVSAVEKHLMRAYEAIAAARLRLGVDSDSPRCLNDKRGRNDGL